MSPREWLRARQPRRARRVRLVRHTAYKDLGVLPVCGGSVRPPASQRVVVAARPQPRTDPSPRTTASPSALRGS